MERSRVGTPVRGRPRSVEAQDSILDAAIDLTREVGFDALAMEAVAARAGVGKSTIYRYWKSKETLLAEAVTRIVRSSPDPDSGSVESDLVTLLNRTVAMYRDPASAQLLSALVAAMSRSDVVAESVRAGFVASRREAMRRVLERGVARGEIRGTFDYELVLDMLSGPLMFRALVSGGPLDTRLAPGIVATVLRGLTPRDEAIP